MNEYLKTLKQEYVKKFGHLPVESRPGFRSFVAQKNFEQNISY